MTKRGDPANRAAAALKAAGIAFAVHSFSAEPGATSAGLDAAAALNVDDNRVFKTIIAMVDDTPTAAIIPVSGALDLAALAAAVGGSNVGLCDASQVEDLTGCGADGVAPIGHEPQLATVIDSSALDYKTIYVCAGHIDTDLELAPADLVAVTRARTAPLVQRS